MIGLWTTGFLFGLPVLSAGDSTHEPRHLFRMKESVDLGSLVAGSNTFHAIRFLDGGETQPLSSRNLAQGTPREIVTTSRVINIRVEGTCEAERKRPVLVQVVFLDGYDNVVVELRRRARPSGKKKCRMKLGQLILSHRELDSIESFHVSFPDDSE
jgi:hypothetical protein